jgi:polyisoprenoid-binding protein YceI
MQTTSQTGTGTRSAAQPSEWTIDASHSHVGFTVRHLMIANVRGELQKLEGTVAWDPARPDATRIDVEIDVASINTRDEKRDAHLRSADFFDADNHPKMTYRSRGVGQRRDGKIEIVGDLTIRGTTRVVVLDVEGPTPEKSDPWGNVRIATSAKAAIKRSEFGMTWNSTLETGGVLVGDEINIEIELELVKKK